jgi:toxin ParE1/3/4
MELENFPRRYRIYDKEPWYSRGLRIMPVDNYVVFYIPITETGIVSVVRVMYAGRDIDNQLINFTDMQK